MRGGDRTIIVGPAFHATELWVARAERAALVLPVDAAKCTGASSVVFFCNAGLGVGAAIESKDVVCRSLRTTEEEQGKTKNREADE